MEVNVKNFQQLGELYAIRERMVQLRSILDGSLEFQSETKPTPAEHWCTKPSMLFRNRTIQVKQIDGTQSWGKNVEIDFPMLLSNVRETEVIQRMLIAALLRQLDTEIQNVERKIQEMP
jgi:hypothetical protein